MLTTWQGKVDNAKQHTERLWRQLSARMPAKVTEFFPASRVQSMFGIDITASSVTLLELDKLGEQYRVKHYAVVPLPVGTMVNQQINKPEKLAIAIERLVTRAKTNTRHAVISLPSSSVISKVIEMNAELTDRALEMEMEFEAGKHIPHAVDQVNLDYTVLGISEKNPAIMEVLLIASLRSNTEKRVEILEQVGVNVEVVDVNAFALERTFQLLRPQLPEAAQQGNVAIINIADLSMTVHIIGAGKVIYSQEEALGGKCLTDLAQRHYQLSKQQVDMLLLSDELPADYSAKVLTPFCNRMVQEVQRLLQFFFSSSEVNAIDHLLLAGTAARTEGLADALHSTLDVAVSVADPLANMVISPDLDHALLRNDACSLLVATGLALRSFDNAQH